MMQEWRHPHPMKGERIHIYKGTKDTCVCLRVRQERGGEGQPSRLRTGSKWASLAPKSKKAYRLTLNLVELDRTNSIVDAAATTRSTLASSHMVCLDRSLPFIELICIDWAGQRVAAGEGGGEGGLLARVHLEGLDATCKAAHHVWWMHAGIDSGGEGYPPLSQEPPSQLPLPA